MRGKAPRLRCKARSRVDAAFSLHATVLFSSVVAQLGSSGQSNYSAANAVLDTLARNDAHSGLPTVSVQWGAWAHVGMAARDKKAMRKLARIGLAPMSPEDGLRALADVLGSCGLQTACAFDWPRLATSGADLQFYGEFVKHLTLNAEASHGAPTPDVSSALSDIAVLEAIKATVAEVLGCDVGVDHPLMDAGLDSLVATELANTISSKLDLRLSPTLAFDYPTITHIAAHVMSKVQPREIVAATTTSALAASPAELRDSPKISVGATSGHLTDMAAAGSMSDGVQMMSLERWDVDAADDQLDVKPRMGTVIAGVEMFDIEAFGVHVAEAAVMDPQHRLLLKHVYGVMAGTDVEARKSVGAFVGTAWTETGTSPFCMVCRLRRTVPHQQP